MTVRIVDRMMKDTVVVDFESGHAFALSFYSLEVVFKMDGLKCRDDLQPL